MWLSRAVAARMCGRRVRSAGLAATEGARRLWAIHSERHAEAQAARTGGWGVCGSPDVGRKRRRRAVWCGEDLE